VNGKKAKRKENQGQIEEETKEEKGLEKEGRL